MRLKATYKLIVVDYEQPLFFRCPSSVKQKKMSARKLGTRRAEAKRENMRVPHFFALRFRSPRPQFSRALFFFCFTLDSTDCEKIGAARSLDCCNDRGNFEICFDNNSTCTCWTLGSFFVEICKNAKNLFRRDIYSIVDVLKAFV